MSSYLLRRGFTYDVVREVVNTLAAELAVQEGNEPGETASLDDGEDTDPSVEG